MNEEQKERLERIIEYVLQNPREYLSVREVDGKIVLVKQDLSLIEWFSLNEE